MGYKNKFGNTLINDERFNNLQINWDYDKDPNKKYPVLLFTPDMQDTNKHYHLALNKKQTKKLLKWLQDYLKEIE